MMTSKPIEPVEVDKRMYMRFKLIALFLFLWGLLLPQDWRQLLGVFGEPIAWVADFVPSIKKMAAISPMPELIRGYFGLAFLIAPVWCLLGVKEISLAKIVRNSLDSAGAVKFVFFNVLCGVSFSLFIIYFIVYLPGSIQLGMQPNRFQFLLTFMITSRLGLAVTGTVLTFGLLLMLFYLVVFLFGPFVYFLKAKNHDN